MDDMFVLEYDNPCTGSLSAWLGLCAAQDKGRLARELRRIGSTTLHNI